MLNFLKTLTVMVAFMFTPSIALAQAEPSCGYRDNIVAGLAEIYGEILFGAGWPSPSIVVEIWVNETTGTWTILRTNTSGIACIMVVGEAWISGLPPVVGDPA